MLLENVSEHPSLHLRGIANLCPLRRYITGGGHSLISGQYGLAADNVLEFRVVTPKGEIKTLNPCENTNLFFAFRGVSPRYHPILISRGPDPNNHDRAAVPASG